MPRYGIIDVGLNTIRLCVYDVSERKGDKLPHLSTLLNHKIMAGLASYVVDGAMSDQGIAKAVHVIRGDLRNAAYFRCKEVRILATACLRNCTNSKDAVAHIEDGIDAKIDLLPGEMEAHLGKEKCGMSLPQGSLSSFSQYVHGLVPSPHEMESITLAFRENLNRRPMRDYAAKELYGIGGSVRSAMKVYGDLFNDGERLGYIELVHLDQMLNAYRNDGAAFAHGSLHTVPDRVHTFIPGCLLLREIFAVTGARRMTVAKKGLREGYLLERVLGK